jgi:molybdenum cofactor biosynthesis enzyme MoaA
LGLSQVKVNVVVVRGVNDMEIADFVALTESMVREPCST